VPKHRGSPLSPTRSLRLLGHHPDGSAAIRTWKESVLSALAVRFDRSDQIEDQLNKSTNPVQTSRVYKIFSWYYMCQDLKVFGISTTCKTAVIVTEINSLRRVVVDRDLHFPRIWRGSALHRVVGVVGKSHENQAGKVIFRVVRLDSAVAPI
jgi:hypothetical protein